jgi:hypothetical protein
LSVNLVAISQNQIQTIVMVELGKDIVIKKSPSLLKTWGFFNALFSTTSPKT